MSRSVPVAAAFPRGGILVDCWEADPRWTSLVPGHFLSPSSFEAQAAAQDGRPLDRKGLQAILLEQNRAFAAAPRALQQADRVADPRALAVIGGQQAGLFSGPLYTVHKALTILALAADLEARLARPVIPVFWIASEDSDAAEIDHATVLDQAGGLRNIVAPPPAAGTGGADRLPVSLLRFGPDIGEAVQALASLLPGSGFSQDVMDAVRSAYAPGRSFPQAFGRLMAWLFSARGLVLVDPSDPRLKALALPLFRREIRQRSPVSEAVREQSRRLAAAGYEAQIELRDGMLTLFRQDPGRESIAVGPGGFQLRASGRTLSEQELVAELESDPGRFTPNAALRPLFQDSVFPTLAAVLGPAELAYFSQLTLAYRRMGVPMPVLFPRATVTLLEQRVARTMDKLGITLHDVLSRGGAIVDDIVRREVPADVRSGLEEGRARVASVWEDLSGRIARLDPTLAPTAQIAAAASMKQFDFIEKKVAQAAKKRDEVLRGQVGRLTDAVLPRGGLQERALNVLPFLARHGTGLLEQEAREVDVFQPLHHCVETGP
jgi:bacillithiol biosynthesis cysteine-adding enzyme BshC